MMLLTKLAVMVGSLHMVLGNVYLRRSELGMSDLADALMDEHTLVQLEEAMGSEHRARTESLMKSITEVLRPIFVALPKNNMGRVGPASAVCATPRLASEGARSSRQVLGKRTSIRSFCR